MAPVHGVAAQKSGPRVPKGDEGPSAGAAGSEKGPSGEVGRPRTVRPTGRGEARTGWRAGPEEGEVSEEGSSSSSTSSSSSDDEALLKAARGRKAPNAREVCPGRRGENEEGQDYDSEGGSKVSGSPELGPNSKALKAGRLAVESAAVVTTERERPPTSFRPADFSNEILHKAASWIQKAFTDAGRRTFKPLRVALTDFLQRDALLFGYERARAKVAWPAAWARENQLYRVMKCIQGALEKRAEENEGPNPFIPLADLCHDLQTGGSGPQIQSKRSSPVGLPGPVSPKLAGSGPQKATREARGGGSKVSSAGSPQRGRGGRPNLSRGGHRVVQSSPRRVVVQGPRNGERAPAEGKRTREVVLEREARGPDPRERKLPRGGDTKKGLRCDEAISLSSLEDGVAAAPAASARAPTKGLILGAKDPLKESLAWASQRGSRGGSQASGAGPDDPSDVSPAEARISPEATSTGPQHSPWGPSPYPLNLCESAWPDSDHQYVTRMGDAVSVGHVLDDPCRWRQEERIQNFGGGLDVGPKGDLILLRSSVAHDRYHPSC